MIEKMLSYGNRERDGRVAITDVDGSQQPSKIRGCRNHSKHRPGSPGRDGVSDLSHSSAHIIKQWLAFGLQLYFVQRVVLAEAHEEVSLLDGGSQYI
ncbi:hypothetical protein IOCL2690_000458400 [Leishmania lindenbergi]|uniref:Uncharacterized protein n=1 Tax=Leishmania lindenbergi TaxID=651832 RepID=A0AAW3AC71_9TRYP